MFTKELVLTMGISAMAFGCAAQTSETQAIIDNLVQAGFPADDMMVVDGKVYVGHDAEVSLQASREMLQVDDSAGSKEQYHTTNIVSSNVTNICVNGATFTGVFSTALNNAIANYNKLGLSWHMTRTNGSTTGCSAVITARISGPIGGSSGVPSGGLPFNTINIGSGLSTFAVGTVTHVITHELGHTVGLRHSDFFDRSISCGGAAINEGAVGVGAILIPGTPSGATFGGSLMNSCFRTVETGQFTQFDIRALNFLYPGLAAAEALSIVDVDASEISCVFNTSCAVTVHDFVANLPMAIMGTARVQSRIFTGTSGSPAAGFNGYEYRVDLTDAVGILNVPCVKALRVTFGPVAAFQYNGMGPTDQVYVISKNGLGTIGLASANKVGDDITFTFATPVCADRESSFFFGLASARAPLAVTAVAFELDNFAHPIAARAPGRDKCSTGGAISTASDPCVSSVCAVDPFCCSTAWDSICVSEVRTVCDSLTCPEANGTCGHSLCTTGASLVNTCDSTKANCVSSICAVDSFCCNTAWDDICMAEVESVCGNNCD